MKPNYLCEGSYLYFTERDLSLQNQLGVPSMNRKARGEGDFERRSFD